MSGAAAPQQSERQALDAEIAAWMAEPEWRPEDERFEALALRLFGFQLAHCPAYRRFCEGRGRTAANVHRWLEIPPVPTSAFKEVALRCFPAEATRVVFRTSGTTRGRRGELHLDTLALYEASLLPSFRRHVLPEGGRLPFAVLAAPPDEAPDSSLSHMFGVALRELGAAGSGFFVRRGALEAGRLIDALERWRRAGEPVALCGTAFGFVHLLDELERRGLVLALPAGSRVMETGGFKGRSRELPRDELYAAIEARLAVPAARIVNQYGMTELGSQFYDSVLARAGEPRRKLEPPWARVAILDPETGRTAAEGEIGQIAVFDLANTGSVFAIQTADLGRRVGDGFEVLGREPGAEERGCSIAADALLDRSAG